MNKIKSKVYSFLLALIFLLVSSANSNASYDNYDNYYNEYYQHFDYYIKNMNVEVEVNDKREYIITETIDAYFNEYKHGIIRNIPLKSTLESYKIKDIDVTGAPYAISKNTSKVDIKIGDANSYVIGDTSYVIKYTLQHYSDNIDEADYLYLNVLGTEWDVPIINFTSTIKYPDSFILNNINITSGSYGNTSNELVEYTLDKNSLVINSKEPIERFQGVTVNMEFEEGAFFNAPTDIKVYILNIIKISGYILLIATLIAIFVSKLKVKRIINVVEFYPPEDMSSVDMGYIYNGVITSEMIVSYIYSWASKGYIKIEIKDKKNMFDKEQITLTRLKTLDVGDDFERDLFRKIFSCGTAGKVTDSQLEYKLHSEFKNIKKKVKQKYRNDERFSKKSSITCRIIRIIHSLLVVLALTTVCFADIGINIITILTMMFMYMFILLPSNGLLEDITYDFNKSFIDNIKGLFTVQLLVLYVFVFYFLVFIVLMYCNFKEVNLIEFAAITLPSVISFALSTMIVATKSSYEEEIYGRICGFKDFIEKAEKDKLEMLISEDPEYFYNILPYAQALGVTDVWSDKFENIAIQKSDYYDYTGSPYRVASISRSLERTMRNADRTESSGSSGGDFSSGGCSGGGSGGGGGSSW